MGEWQMTRNAKRERTGKAQEAHSNLISKLVQTGGPSVEPSPASWKDYSSWLFTLTNPSFPQETVHARTCGGPQKVEI